MKTKHPLEILVIGSTGRQGGSVARALLARGHSVRAFTRSPRSNAAKALAELGAELMTGDLADPICVEGAASGTDGVFSVQNWRDGGVDLEVRHGIAVANACRNASVPHLVYSSVASADRRTGIPHFESKARIEEHIVGLGVPYTICGPVTFMENILSPLSLPALKEGRLAKALPPRRKIQLIAVSDIGEFVASVFERQDEVLGRRIDIAGDELTGEEQAAVVSRVTGRKIRYEQIPPDAQRAVDRDAAIMNEWIDRVGYDADIPGLRREFADVGFHSFESWAREQDWSSLLA